MPYANEHAARLQDPSKFDSFGRTHGGNLYGGNLKAPSTIDVIWGHPKGGPEEAAVPQALRFPIEHWTEEEARKWLKDHNVKYAVFEPASKSKERAEGMNSVKILARVLAMAESEILGMVSPRAIRDIKREDPSPRLMAFVVGQEGEARPTMLGIGTTVQRWFTSAIERLTDRLMLGTPAYYEHTHPQERNRQPIGEIVGKALRHIKGTLSSIAVTYIFPMFRDLPLDIASVEASILMPTDTREFDVTDLDVKEVTGVALGHSSTNNPAFPGATLLAQLQAFAEKIPEQGDQTNMTLDEIKKAIQEGKHKPSDIFSPKELTSDPVIADYVDEKTTNLKGYQVRKLQEVDQKVETLEKEKKELMTKVEAHEKTIAKGRAKETFDKVIVERPKLKEDGRLLKFVQKAFEKSFDPKKEAELKKEIDEFVDSQVKEYQELFGEPGAGDKGKSGGAPKAEPNAGGEQDDSLLNPKNNDLIPQD